jgi:oxygen-independent coproporphyrinogen-3 oxidase
MINVKLKGHEYRYEAYQILSLFYAKSEIVFNMFESDIESTFDTQLSLVECEIKSALISKKLHVNILDKKNIKNSIKMTLLKCLEEFTGITIPWGILVGIRPTKVIHDYFNKGLAEDEIIMHLTNDYSLSIEKCNLAIEVAKKEAVFLNKANKSVSIYIGIPFCPTRCVYCSFTSNPIWKNQDLVNCYLNSLLKEINSVFSYLKDSGYNIDTLYVGGGTPTSLNVHQLNKLLSNINYNIPIKDLREVTIEAGRPDSIDLDKLSLIREFGCSRISINPQSMNDETLKRIGRNHTSSDIIAKYNMARELGFDNINMDIIIGLPGEGEKEIQKTMDALEKLSPDSITIHTMSIKRASILNEMEYDVKNSTASIMYDIASSRVREMGMYPYYMYRQKNMVVPLENVGYCRPNKESIYNIQMIAENIPIVSFGADAITKIIFDNENRIERVANVKDVREYVNRIDEMIENKIEAISMLTK